MSSSRPIHIWGIYPVLELLQSTPEQIREITIQKPGSSGKQQQIISLAGKNKIIVKVVAKLTIPGEASANHQGVLARLDDYKTYSLKEFLEDKHQLLVALDSIHDPHNLGAIIRSAAAAGATGILIPKDRAAQISGTIAKVAAGALAHIKICIVTNLADSLQKLKESGFWIYGAAGEAQQTIYETDFSGKTCLVIGSEGKGLRPLVQKNCDLLVRIPMNKAINSLNASVSAGIILFEIARQKDNH